MKIALYQTMGVAMIALSESAAGVKIKAHEEAKKGKGYDPGMNEELGQYGYLNTWQLNDCRDALYRMHPQAGKFFDLYSEEQQKKMIYEGGVDSIAMAIPALGAVMRGEDPVKGA